MPHDPHDERYEVHNAEAQRALRTTAVLIDEQLPDGWAWGLFLMARMGEGEATYWISNAERAGMIDVVRGWLQKQQAVPQPAAEPEWLGRLRLALGKHAGGSVLVSEADLLEAVGAAAPGPGATAMVGLDPEAPMVMVDFQTLVRFVRFTEPEARGMARSLLRKANLLAPGRWTRSKVEAAAGFISGQRISTVREMSIQDLAQVHGEIAAMLLAYADVLPPAEDGQ